MEDEDDLKLIQDGDTQWIIDKKNAITGCWYFNKYHALYEIIKDEYLHKKYHNAMLKLKGGEKK